MNKKFLICLAVSSTFILSSCGRKLLNSPEGIEASAVSKSTAVRNNLQNNTNFSASDINAISSVFDNLNNGPSNVSSSGSVNSSGYKNYPDDQDRARTEFFEDAGLDIRSSALDSAGSGGYNYTPSSLEQKVVAVALPERELNLSEGEQIDIDATVYYRDASLIDRVNWSSSNSDVVKVDSRGNIEAVSDGEAVIKARAKDDATRYEEIKITVKAASETEE